jgi:hypothetical protein
MVGVVHPEIVPPRKQGKATIPAVADQVDELRRREPLQEFRHVEDIVRCLVSPARLALTSGVFFKQSPDNGLRRTAVLLPQLLGKRIDHEPNAVKIGLQEVCTLPVQFLQVSRCQLCQIADDSVR